MNESPKNEYEALRAAVVIPVHNTARYLAECLESLLAQTHRNFTAFVIDDGSSDESLAILRVYEKRDERLRVFTQVNTGVSRARNRMLDLIEEDGEFFAVTFLDSDDLYAPGFLAETIEALADEKADYAVCGVENFTRKGLERRRLAPMVRRVVDREGASEHFFHPRSLQGRVDPTVTSFLCNRVFRASTVRGLRFEPDVRSGEDQIYVFEALLRIDKGVIVPSVLYRYRLRNSSLSHSGDPEGVALWLYETAIDRFSGPDVPEALKVGLRKSLVTSWWYVMTRAYTSGATDVRLREIRRLYRKICDEKLARSAPFKLRRYLALYGLGESCVKYYLRFRKRRPDDLLKPHPDFFD